MVQLSNLMSDESWKTAPGPIIFTSIYGGEDYNANLEQHVLEYPSNFNDASWRNVVIVTKGSPQLNAQAAYPLKSDAGIYSG